MSDETTDNKQLSPKPTLWVVSELYYPEETSAGYYLTHIAEGLADDARVKVLCAQPTYSKREYERQSTRFTTELRSSGLRAQRLI